MLLNIKENPVQKKKEIFNKVFAQHPSEFCAINKTCCQKVCCQKNSRNQASHDTKESFIIKDFYQKLRLNGGKKKRKSIL